MQLELSSTVAHRLNLANRLTDQARALMAADARDEESYELLLESVRTEPGFVNAYATLAEWFGPSEDVREQLWSVWRTHGRHDARAQRFLEQYGAGDTAARLGDWCAQTGTGSALIVHASDDLAATDLYDYAGVEGEPPAFIGRIDSPRLVCSPRDFDALPAAKKAIAEDAVKRGKDHRVIAHRGTLVHAGHRAVFGPAIDSLHFNSVLHETVYRSRLADTVGRVAEVGVGSGFLLCSVLGALTRRPLQLFGSDIDPAAVATAGRNVRHALSGASGVELRIERDARMLERLDDRGVDLLLCNPPYIPERRYAGENAYSGVRVIEALLCEHAPRVLAPGGAAVLLFSSLAAPAVERCLERCPLVPVTLAPGRTVPLDLREVGSDPRWIGLLLRDYGLEERLADPSYAYWHTLHMIALCRPESLDLIAELEAVTR